GRFISVDPVMNLADPEQWHGYAYANNNPVTFADASGMLVLPPLLDGAYVPHNSSSPLAGRQVARDRTGYGWTVKVPPVDDSTDDDADDNFVKEFAEGAADYGAEVVDGMVELAKTQWNYLTECLNGSAWRGDCGNFFDFNKQLFSGLNPLTALDGLVSEFKNLEELFNSGRTAYALGRLSAIVLETLVSKGGGKAALLAIKALKKVPDAPSCNSFAPGTLVLLADGTWKAIEDVELGDVVLAADEKTGETTEGREVTRLIRGEGAKTLVTITVNDTDGESQEIVATDEHPFWAPDLQEWVDAIDLKAGSWLQTAAGTWVQVASVDVRHERAAVYNLTVDIDHTYYVLAGATPVLVHNCNNAATHDVGNVVDNLDDNVYFHYTSEGGHSGILADDGSLRIGANSAGKVHVTQEIGSPAEIEQNIFIRNPMYAGKADYMFAFRMPEGVELGPGSQPNELITRGSLKIPAGNVLFHGKNPF
ncbi:polymorphic toxin-type HINT domain-containing protein, partial [Isoptericola sediminis]